MQIAPRADRFVLWPVIAAMVVWAVSAAPLVTSAHGGLLFSLWEMSEAGILLVAVLLWLIAFATTALRKRWRKAASLTGAAVAFFLATVTAIHFRPQLMILAARAEIDAALALHGRGDGLPYRANREVSDANSNVWSLLVYDETDADAPVPGKSEKTWINYDWNRNGCTVTARPLGRHFYLESIRCPTHP